MKNYFSNQKGFGPVIILIGLAVVVGLAAVFYGYFIISKNPKPAAAVPLPPENISISRQTVQPGTPECPEVDYTGCDNSGNFMTWKDDGTEDSEPDPLHRLK